MAKQMDLSEVSVALNKKYHEFLFSYLATKKVQEAVDNAENLLYYGDVSDTVLGAIKQLKKDRADFVQRTAVVASECEEMCDKVEPVLKANRDDYAHLLLGYISSYKGVIASFESEFKTALKEEQKTK